MTEIVHSDAGPVAILSAGVDSGELPGRGDDVTTTLPATPSLLEQIWARFLPARPDDYACAGFHDLDQSLSAEVRGFVADSYPRNHTFTASGERLVPRPKLANRVARLSRNYSTGFRSFIDLSCSKGFFVFHAAMHQGCERAMGIDLDEQCLDACRKLQKQFEGRERVQFEKLTIPELADRIDQFGGPFETAMLVNTYQYLVFGSSIAPRVSYDHREIFHLLRRICSGRLIFHNRLRLADLQDSVQEGLTPECRQAVYEPEAIASAASEYFHVSRLDRWSKRPVWLLDAK